MYIDEDTKQEILAKATLEEALNKYCQTARGRNKYECPFCGKPMEYHPGKKLVKCFHCDWGTNSAVTLLMESTKCTFPEALERLAADFGVVVPEKKYPARKPKGAAKAEAWYKGQLAASGLTSADVRAWLYEADGTRMQVNPFSQGTIGPDGTPSDQGDDMLIRYLDLDGHRLQYTPTLKNGRAGEPRDYFRVRWQIPESHMLRDGSIGKYKSPAGSGVQLYIPERLREAYRTRRQLEALYFTEGEKKAEAVSKYVGPAFGLAGINCLVGKDKQLPEAIVRVVEACQVQKVYFIMDADWDELSKNLDPESDIRQRPQAFFSAARNFGAWFATLRNRKLFVDAYLVLGKGEQKGVDDQLAALKGAEYQYGDQIKKATSAAIEGGHTDYFDLYNITTMPEAKLQAVWHLDSIESFVGHHRKRLQEMESFRAWRNQWRLDEGGHLQLAQPLADDEQFWEVKKRKSRYGEEFEEYTFDYVNILNFLERRGYFQIKEAVTGDRQFIHVQKNRIEPTTAADIKDTVLDFARTLNNKPLLAMLYRGSTQYLGPEKMSNLSTLSFTPTLPPAEAGGQMIYFKNKYWHVTADGIEERDYAGMEYHYRREWCKPVDPQRLAGRMVCVERTDEGGLIVGLAGERITNNFKFYAVFQENVEYSVHAGSEELGTIVRPPEPGNKIAIAGRVWNVDEVDHKQLRVLVTLVKGSIPAYFGDVAGDIHTHILERMYEVLSEDTVYPYLLRHARARLLEARKIFFQSGMERPLIHLGGNMYALFPWLGTFAFLALERLLKIKCASRLGLKSLVSSRPYYLRFTMQVDACEFFQVVREEVSRKFDPLDLVFPNEVPVFEKYDPYVPEELVRKGFAYGVLDVEGMKKRVLSWH